jgi:hypothetical protein
MTRQEWDRLWLAQFNTYYNEGRSLERSRVRAWDETTRLYGPRPESAADPQKPPGLPWGYRIVLSLVVSRLRDMVALEDKMGQRLLAAAIFAVVTFVGILQTSGMPKDLAGWVTAVVTALVAGYGKYSSNTTILAPNRAEWTPAERAANAAK